MESQLGSRDTAHENVTAASPQMQRVHRWTRPFGEMNDEDVVRVLEHRPFSAMCARPEDAHQRRFMSFNVPITIFGIVKNDCRFRSIRSGEFVLRKNDYGNSAFIVLDGKLRCFVHSDVPEPWLGRSQSKMLGFPAAVGNMIKSSLFPNPPEYRSEKYGKGPEQEIGAKVSQAQLEELLDESKFRSETYVPGDLFGESGAMYRTPRSATVIAEEPSVLLEMRWQGLRDLMHISDAFSEHVDSLYRERTLQGRQRLPAEFDQLPNDRLPEIEFETYGKFDEWSYDYLSLSPDERQKVVESEQIIVEEGTYPNSVVVVASGFARESRRQGSGHQTLSYLASSQVFGFAEAYHNWKNPENAIPWQRSLRAIGYAHVLKIPIHLVEDFVLPSMEAKGECKGIANSLAERPEQRGFSSARDRIEGDAMEFFVENRLINGRQTMLIDMDRCTRCDDCVRACASVHDGNPRFLRQGRMYQHLVAANACMHCADPVCMIGCPTGAIHREQTHGQVVINEESCIGCSTCYQNCPYDAIRMVPIRDRSGSFFLGAAGPDRGKPIYKATKCDLCIDQPTGPACVRACPHDALVRVDMRDAKVVSAHVDS